VCSTHVKRQKFVHSFRRENLNGRHGLQYLALRGRILLKWVLKKWGINTIWLRICAEDRLKTSQRVRNNVVSMN
jgi:hypothetical protein